jgi:hypothetical protein
LGILESRFGDQWNTYEATAVKGIEFPVRAALRATGASVIGVRVGHKQMHGC